MSFNLIREAWLPVRTSSGARRVIRPAEIAQRENPPVAFDYPRPDLETAAHELLIGLLSVALAPRDNQEWRRRYQEAPSVAELDDLFAPLAGAFDLDGDGPRFCQELGGLDGAPNPIDSLFIDAPGENAAKKNSDLLTHRGRYGALSRAAAAIALYALQSAAPSGGAGIRTSLRGGGPLSLMLLPPDDAEGAAPPLWRRLWANVVELSALDEEADPDPELARVFPWLAPPIGDGKLQPSDPRTHPWQAFFGAPRRLWLIFEEGRALCPILGVEDTRPAVGVVQKPRGVDYGLWTHPLTPYRRQKEAGEPYSAKPKSGRLGYRDWVAGVLGDAHGLRMPPACVTAAGRRASTLTHDGAARLRARAAGWAMNNMEARAYLLAEEPLHLAR
ncbi:MAG: type I-E CRISPR-associated protein Cse1/CasA, partial [Pseudomonadota bacterium]